MMPMDVMGRKMLQCVGDECLLFAEMGWWDLIWLYLCCSAVMGIVFFVMAKGKQPKETAAVKAKAKAVAESTKKRKGRDGQPVPRAAAASSARGDRGKRPASASESSEFELEEEEPELRNWANAVAKKVFNCERGVVQRDFIHTSTVAQVIEFHHIEFLYQDFEGYYADYVRQFYTHLHEPEDSVDELRTWVNNSVVVVTPDIIARNLGYQRPPPELNPHPPRDLEDRGLDVLIPATYKRGVQFTGTFAPGSFHSDCALLNKLNHASLLPGGKEKKPAQHEVNFLYEVMHRGVIDFAALIFGAMKIFRQRNWTAALPYPCLVTKICQEQQVKARRDEVWIKPKFGPLMQATRNKSKAISKRGIPPVPEPPAAAVPPAPEDPAPPRRQSSPLQKLRNELKGWFKCLLGKQRKLESRLDSIEREQRAARSGLQPSPPHAPNLEQSLSDELDEFVEDVEDDEEEFEGEEDFDVPVDAEESSDDD